MEKSLGQQLLHDKKLIQASCFFASHIPKSIRLQWSDSFPKAEHRLQESKLKDSAIFLVLSQNCDIACRNDVNDSAIELAICKKIKERDVFPGNSFVKSVRKLHFHAKGNWYEANVDYILTVKKAELLEQIQNTPSLALIQLNSEFAKCIPVWRANRYLRSALPDSFNDKLERVLTKHILNIEKIAESNQLEFSSYIRAFYIYVDPIDEAETYSFEFFALLRDDISDKTFTALQDSIELMAEDLVADSGYVDISDIYTGRENNTTVAYLTRLTRLNLDHSSLSADDDDTGPKEL